MTEKTEKMDTSEYEKISLKPIKGSRKSKKAWRKHGDIGDIEQHLESVWQDQRSGANKLTEKPDDVLFQMDTTPKIDVKGKKKKNKGAIKLNALFDWNGWLNFDYPSIYA